MTGIFYGSTTGNTETLAKEIASALGVTSADVYDVGGSPIDKVAGYDTLLLGSSTWGLGELQDDWYSFVEELKKADLSGKKVGLFGCGDSASYPDTFCESIGLLHEELSDTGCTFIGQMDASGYPNNSSKAFEGGQVLGLAVDDDEPNKTEGRLKAWVAVIKES